MSDIVDQYLEGIRTFPKHKKLTPASLCKFLGKDASSLKRDRIADYPYLKIVFDTIDNVQKNKSETPIAREKRLKNIYKSDSDEFESLLNAAYAREVTLIHRIDELERSLQMYENFGQLKLLKPRK
jgi:hypothetical protein